MIVSALSQLTRVPGGFEPEDELERLSEWKMINEEIIKEEKYDWGVAPENLIEENRAIKRRVRELLQKNPR